VNAEPSVSMGDPCLTRSVRPRSGRRRACGAVSSWADLAGGLSPQRLPWEDYWPFQRLPTRKPAPAGRTRCPSAATSRSDPVAGDTAKARFVCFLPIASAKALDPERGEWKVHPTRDEPIVSVFPVRRIRGRARLRARLERRGVALPAALAACLLGIVTQLAWCRVRRSVHQNFVGGHCACHASLLRKVKGSPSRAAACGLPPSGRARYEYGTDPRKTVRLECVSGRSMPGRALLSQSQPKRRCPPAVPRTLACEKRDFAVLASRAAFTAGSKVLVPIGEAIVTQYGIPAPIIEIARCQLAGRGFGVPFGPRDFSTNQGRALDSSPAAEARSSARPASAAPAGTATPGASPSPPRGRRPGRLGRTPCRPRSRRPRRARPPHRADRTAMHRRTTRPRILRAR
jgi:hypothetical protein